MIKRLWPLLLLALSGCAGLQYKEMTNIRNPSASEADWQRDSYECEHASAQQAYQEGMGGNVFTQARENANCLMARGWRKRSQ